MPYQIDRDKCLCCHNCALECPVGAIGFKGTGYQVDESVCIDCGHCAKVCNVAAPYQVGVPAPVPVPHEQKELEADIVVLGAGASGIVAAARAAQLSGRKVIVLEKAAKFGGSGWFAGFVVSAAGSKRVMPPMFAKAEEALKKGGVDPEIIKTAREKPGEFFQWFRQLDSRVDQLWVPIPGTNGNVSLGLKERVFFNKKCKDKAIGPGRSTSVMEQILVEHFDELGITLLTEHEAIAIEKDGSGAICGVMAQDPGGQVHIRCQAVICCTGGFANNEELLRQYAPQYYGPEGSEHTHRFAAPTNTGDVVRLGESVGAYLARDSFFANVFGPVHHPFSFCLFSFANQAEMVTVNLEGHRFLDESIFAGGAAKMYHQPRRIVWSILDHSTRQKLGERLSNGPDAPYLRDFEAEFDEEEALDTPLKKADTLEELADLCGIDREAFVDTIARYNEYCRKGEDDEFGKRPETLWPVEQAPFYAIYGKVACDGAFGGMLVNGKTEVYRADQTGVIPGLYAAGDNASGWALKSEEEGDHRLMATNECNWAIASGFTAAEQASAYLMILHR
ncbi:MAG: FAD-binding protein [Oscillospiraceae bacterium]|nr:FAD-binding protein [Oscillospiraceae bacterium]